MALVTLEAAKKIQLKTETVHIARLGGEVILRELGGTDRDTLEDTIFKLQRGGKDKTIKGVKALLVSLCWVDEQGTRVAMNANELNTLPGGALSEMADHAQRINGMTESEVEQIAKN